jgi:hypothetical protein
MLSLEREKSQTKALVEAGLDQDPEILEGRISFRMKIRGTVKYECSFPRFPWLMSRFDKSL